MEFKTLLFKKEEGIGTITFNRPQVMNAFNTELLKELSQAVDMADYDEEIRVLMFTGNDKVFAAGGDLASLSTANPLSIQARGGIALKIYEKLTTMDKPTMAVMAGMALGGGCELALACDIRIAAEGTLIGLLEINVGLMPGSGGTVRLQKIVGPGWAKYMTMTGESIDTDTAFKIGLVTVVVPPENLMAVANKIATRLARKAPIAMASIKKSIDNAGDVDQYSAIRFEQKNFALLFATEDTKEGIAAFLEKRRPVFKGK